MLSRIGTRDNNDILAALIVLVVLGPVVDGVGMLFDFVIRYKSSTIFANRSVFNGETSLLVDVLVAGDFDGLTLGGVEGSANYGVGDGGGHVAFEQWLWRSVV